MIAADGCWADYRTSREVTRDRPCLFLDRDGVLIEDTGFPHVAAEVVLISEVIACVAAAQQAGFVVGIVSNQSGIGRGYFAWNAFSAVQEVIDGALTALGARLDFVLACPFHPQASLPQFQGDHPWRKPNPGMLVAARDRLALDVRHSVMLGDRRSDMEAALGAGVAHRLLLGKAAAGGNGIRPITRPELRTELETLAPLASDRPSRPASA